MTSLRVLIGRHRSAAALLIALALVVKALVPAGFMVGARSHVLTIAVCADALGGKTTMRITVPQRPDQEERSADHGKAAPACAYSALSTGALASADPFVLAVALAFVLALGFAPVRAAPARATPRYRPPLRGPPAFV